MDTDSGTVREWAGRALVLRRLSLAGGSVLGSVGGLVLFLCVERVYTNRKHYAPRGAPKETR